MRQLIYIKKTLNRGDVQSINAVQAYLTLFRLALAEPDRSKSAGLVVGSSVEDVPDEWLIMREGVLQSALDGMHSAISDLEERAVGITDATVLIFDVKRALAELSDIKGLLVNPVHRENVERLILPSIQVLVNSTLTPLVRVLQIAEMSKSAPPPTTGCRRWLRMRNFLKFGPSRVGVFRALNKLGRYSLEGSASNFTAALLDTCSLLTPVRDRKVTHLCQYKVNGYLFLRYMGSKANRCLHRYRKRAMIVKRTKRRRQLRQRRRRLRRTYRMARQRRQWARRWKNRRLMPYSRWLRNRGGAYLSLGYVRSLAKSVMFRYWKPTAVRRRLFIFRSTIMPRRKLRVPTAVWWRRFIRWHNYWLTSRKRKPQKRYKPLREAKRFMFKRFRRWPMARVRQVRAGMYRNPSCGKWWSRGSIFPRKYRRKRISKYAKLLKWRNLMFRTSTLETQQRRARFYIAKIKGNRANYFALSQTQLRALGVQFEKAKFENVPEESLNDLIRIKKKAFFFSRTARFGQRRFLRRLRYFLPRWKKRRLKFFRRKIPQVFGYFIPLKSPIKAQRLGSRQAPIRWFL